MNLNRLTKAQLIQRIEDSGNADPETRALARVVKALEELTGYHPTNNLYAYGGEEPDPIRIPRTVSVSYDEEKYPTREKFAKGQYVEAVERILHQAAYRFGVRL